MGTARSLATLTLLYSLSGASAIRTGISAVARKPLMSLINTDVMIDDAYNRLKMVAGNCGILTMRDGLAVGESVKVTSNGWADEARDFVVELISDESDEAKVLRSSEHGRSSVPEPPPTATPPVSPSGEDLKPIPEGGDSAGRPEEVPAVPFVGVRIPGALKTSDAYPTTLNRDAVSGENGGGKVDPRKPAVLLYNRDPAIPSQVNIDSPAGPQSSFMVMFTMISSTEMEVTIYTWKRDMGQSEHTRTVTGTWHKASAIVGTGSNTRDLRVTVNDCRPKVYKVYGSSSARMITSEDGTKDGVCLLPEPPLVAIYPAPLEKGGGGDEKNTVGGSSGDDKTAGGDKNTVGKAANGIYTVGKRTSGTSPLSEGTG